MNTADLLRRLEAEREELRSQQAEPPLALENLEDDRGVSQHSADDATDLFLRDRDIALRRNAEELLAQIDAAIGRIEDGSYGACRRCGQPIAEERLEALPHAVYCIGCQAAVEAGA